MRPRTLIQMTFARGPQFVRALLHMPSVSESARGFHAQTCGRPPVRALASSFGHAHCNAHDLLEGPQLKTCRSRTDARVAGADLACNCLCDMESNALDKRP